MMTVLALFLVALAVLAAVAYPLWQSMRQPWNLNIPQGGVEARYQEKSSALESLRDLAMDFKLGKLSAADYRSLAVPLQKQVRGAMQAQSASQNATLPSALAKLDAHLETQILAMRRTLPPGPTLTGAPFNFCPQCGAQVTSEYRFCAACGAKLPFAESNQQQSNGQTVLAQPNVDVETSSRSTSVGTTIRPDANDTESNAATSFSENSQRADTSGPSDAFLVAQVPEQAAQLATERATHIRYRWWGVAAVIAAVWVVAVIWLYLTGRSSQLDQVPVTTLSMGPVQALAVTDARLVVAAPNGVQQSSDGQAWNASPLTDNVTSVVALDPAGDSWLAAGPNGLWRSQDGAVSWGRVDTTSTGLGLITMTIAPGQPDVIWAADARTLYVSHDGGESWEVVNSVLPGRVSSLTAGSTQLFLGTDQGVFRSQDRGASWTDFNGLVNGRIGSTDIQALAYDETGNLLFAGTPRGLYFMNLNSPAGWGQRALNADVTELALHGATSAEVWAGAANGQLFRSQDRGVTWR